MLNFPEATKVFLATDAVDMRKSFNTLAALACEHLDEDIFCGAIFLFSNKSRNRLKILYWDGSGLWVLAKRLDKGAFRWPRIEGPARKVALSQADLRSLLTGENPRYHFVD